MILDPELEDKFLDCKELFHEIEKLTMRFDRAPVNKQVIQEAYDKTQELITILQTLPDLQMLIPLLSHFEGALGKLKDFKIRLNRSSVDPLIGAFDLCCQWFTSIQSGSTITSETLDAATRYMTVLRLLK